MSIHRLLPRAATTSRRRFLPGIALLVGGAVTLAATLLPRDVGARPAAPTGPAAAAPAVPQGATPLPGAPPAAPGAPTPAPPEPQAAPAAAAPPPTPATPPPPGGPPPVWARKLPSAGVAWAPAIHDTATREGLDPRLLASLVWVESAFDPAAVSPVGALGLAQVMPATAAELGIDPLNAVQNLAGGARYLKANLDRFGRTDLALAAYNAGPGRVAEKRTVPAIPETQNYVTRVLAIYQRLR